VKVSRKCPTKDVCSGENFPVQNDGPSRLAWHQGFPYHLRFDIGGFICQTIWKLCDVAARLRCSVPCRMKHLNKF